jgi:hypothetical protein
MNLCSKPFSLQTLCNHLGFQEEQEWSMTSLWQGTETTPKDQQSLERQDPHTHQMRTITYKDEAATWSRSSHLMKTRFLPWSDDSDNFSGTNGEWRQTLSQLTKSHMINPETISHQTTCHDVWPPKHTCDWDCFIIMHTSPHALILCLLKTKAHVCTWKMAEDGLKFLLCLFQWYVLAK